MQQMAPRLRPRPRPESVVRRAYGRRQLVDLSLDARTTARSLERLAEYDFDIIHKPGLQNVDADGLSRHPIPATLDDQIALMSTATVPVLPSNPASYLVCVAKHSQFACAIEAPDDSFFSEDVWLDVPLLHHLQTGTYLPSISTLQKDRINTEPENMFGRTIS